MVATLSCEHADFCPDCLRFPETLTLDEANEQNLIEYCPKLPTCPKWSKTGFAKPRSPPERASKTHPRLTPKTQSFFNDFVDKLEGIHGDKELIPVDRETAYSELKNFPLLKRELFDREQSIYFYALFDKGFLNTRLLGDLKRTEEILTYYKESNQWNDLPQYLKFTTILGLSPLNAQEHSRLKKSTKLQMEDALLDAFNFEKLTPESVIQGHINDIIEEMKQ